MNARVSLQIQKLLETVHVHAHRIRDKTEERCTAGLRPVHLNTSDAYAKLFQMNK